EKGKDAIFEPVLLPACDLDLVQQRRELLVGFHRRLVVVEPGETSVDLGDFLLEFAPRFTIGSQLAIDLGETVPGRGNLRVEFAFGRRQLRKPPACRFGGRIAVLKSY